MKTENTPANKAKFFALYFNQKVYRRNGVEYDSDVLTTELLHGDIFATDATFFMQNGHLSLRSIGILMPWMDLSGEDIKAYGWAVEREDGDVSIKGN